MLQNAQQLLRRTTDTSPRGHADAFERSAVHSQLSWKIGFTIPRTVSAHGVR
jgi:hypothetical protein